VSHGTSYDWRLHVEDDIRLEMLFGLFTGFWQQVTAGCWRNRGRIRQCWSGYRCSHRCGNNSRCWYGNCFRHCTRTCIRPEWPTAPHDDVDFSRINHWEWRLELANGCRLEIIVRHPQVFYNTTEKLKERRRRHGINCKWSR